MRRRAGRKAPAERDARHAGRRSPARHRKAQSDPLDIAVVVFARPVTGRAPASLPVLGLLDTMKAGGALDQGTRFTSVGYGSQEPVTAPPGPPVNAYEDIREYAVGSFSALGPGFLRLSQNPATGDAAPASPTPAGRTSSAPEPRRP